MFEQNLQEISKRLTELLSKKNHDYGNSFELELDEYGLVVYLIRLNEKLNRLKKLNKSEAKVEDEKLEDTITDIAGYTMLLLEYIERKGLPTNK